MSSSDDWESIACSVAGTSHTRSGRPAEDICTVMEVASATVLALADGAGSATHAREGATLAVAASLETAARLLAGSDPPSDQEAWHRLLGECLRSARRAIDARDEPRNKLACTLILTILQGDTLAAARIGDGWIVAEHRDGEVRAVLVPEKGEYFNETFFLSSDRYLDRAAFRTESASELTGVAILSDGLEMAACDLQAMQPFAPFFTRLFEFVRDRSSSRDARRVEVESLLDSDRINQKTDDDKSLVIAVRGVGGSATA